MTLFMPPIQRKKKVDEKYNPDTFRVISEDAISDHPKYRPLPYRASFEPRTPTPKVKQNVNTNAQETAPVPEVTEPLRPLKNTRVLPQILPDHRANKPQPKSCGFLDRNVRFLNEPICNVYTAPVQHQEKQWWPARANPGELVIPPYAEDTNYRVDYNYRHGERPTGSGRHTAYTNREAALGTIPVNYLKERDGSQRFYKEGISYEHAYDSRADPNYPIRGKTVKFADDFDQKLEATVANNSYGNPSSRHGGFVWSRMDPISQRKFVEYYERLAEQEMNAESAAANGTPVVVMSGKNSTAGSRRGSKGSQSAGTPRRKASTASGTGKPVNENSVVAEVPEPAAMPPAPVTNGSPAETVCQANNGTNSEVKVEQKIETESKEVDTAAENVLS